MSENTKISWADHTASPWFGCTKKSAGCENCYAEQWAKKLKIGWGDNSPRVRSKSFEKNCRKWNRDNERKRFEWAIQNPYETRSGQRCPVESPRVFASLCDPLDPNVPLDWLADYLRVIHETPHLMHLFLTKRPENFERVRECLDSLSACPADFETWILQWDDGFAPHNVWLGVTVENQAMAYKRIPILLSIPARVRWLSVEPLLSLIWLEPWLVATKNRRVTPPQEIGIPRLNWVVVGGESGPKRRDCGVEAIVDVVRQCREAGVPVWVKQDSALKPGQQGRIPDDIWALKELPI